MVSLFLLLGCNLSYILDLFAGLHELVSASARTSLKLTSSVHVLSKSYGDTLKESTVSICNKVRKANKVWNNMYNKGWEIHQLKLTSVSVHLWLLVLGSIPDVQLQNDVILSCFLFFLHQR